MPFPSIKLIPTYIKLLSTYREGEKESERQLSILLAGFVHFINSLWQERYILCYVTTGMMEFFFNNPS